MVTNLLVNFYNPLRLGPIVGYPLMPLLGNIRFIHHTIAEAIKKRNTLFRTAKRTGKLSDRVKYTVKRNQVVAMLRNSKQSFFDELNSADSKTFWKTVRLLNNQQSSVPTLQHNGIAIETASNKAAVLNNFFYSCFNHSFSPLTSSDTTFDHNDLEPADCPKELL